MTDDLKKAIERVNDAQKAMNDAYTKGYRDGFESAYLNTDEVANCLADLENQVRNFKERAIQNAVDDGLRTKDVAQSFGISSARVSQIAPRKRKD
ncbi:hypothetical protein NMT03_001007 [Vibrio alginolyticus]|nr:hypothetical protein [Vibrio alginolyticus]